MRISSNLRSHKSKVTTPIIMIKRERFSFCLFFVCYIYFTICFSYNSLKVFCISDCVSFISFYYYFLTSFIMWHLIFFSSGATSNWTLIYSIFESNYFNYFCSATDYGLVWLTIWKIWLTERLEWRKLNFLRVSECLRNSFKMSNLC